MSGLLSTINASAIVTVLPIIQAELGADIVTIGLTLTIYQLITASLMLAFGRLGDLRRATTAAAKTAAGQPVLTQEPAP